MDVIAEPHLDRSERKIHFLSVQDVEPILEHNKAIVDEPQRDDGWRHVADIPNIIIYQWLTEEWARGNATAKWTDTEFDKVVQRKLRDPDWRNLLTGIL